MHIVRSKWIFKIKYKPDGKIDRNKAMIVAQGFSQTPELYFFDTFSPVIKPATIRIVLSIIAKLNWLVHQVDVNNAFLNEELQENVYMRQPQGFEDKNQPTHVCKLHKALYWLKQAPKAWFDKLKESLLLWGFNHNKYDSSLFYLVSASKVLSF